MERHGELKYQETAVKDTNHHSTPIRTALWKIKATSIGKHGAAEPLWGWKMKQLLWKTDWQFLKKQIRTDINRQMIQKHEQKLRFIMALLKMATKQKKPECSRKDKRTSRQEGVCTMRQQPSVLERKGHQYLHEASREADLQRQRVERWLQGLGGEERMDSGSLMRTKLQFGKKRML